jgi:hypothetical protein
MMQDRAHDALRFRMVTHVVSMQSLEVGDVDGHIASLARFSGLAFYTDGTVGAVNFVSLTDYTNGVGSFTLFPILSFDVSERWVKSDGTAKVDGSNTRFVGTLTVTGGKGRFAGAEGDGTLTGTRYTPIAVGADLVSEYTIRIEKQNLAQDLFGPKTP